MVPRWRIFGDLLGLVFSASRVQHISDLHPKFTLTPHHMYKYGSVAIDLSATNTQLLPPGRTWNVVKPLARWRCAARRASLAAHFLFI